VVLEPEGLDVDEVYLNGMSMSLPRDVQESVVRSLAGLEGARLLRHGYAVEYDAVFADELDSSLQSRRVPRLWLAGQVNGTSGYEEAAAQGMVAGINAARSVRGESALVLGRQDAYIGVLVNDLSSNDQLEPYRMFTSRLSIVCCCVPQRRFAPDTHWASLGLVDDGRWAVFEARRDRLAENRRRLESTRILVGGVRQPVRDVVKRQDVRLQALVDEGRVDLVRGPADGLELLGLESDIKYEGYLKRHEREQQRANEQMTTPIPASLDLSSLPGLSRELRQRLSDRRPASLADARSVPGMTPAALALIGMHARRSQDSEGEGES
jgi:tRNA uridine 5-carboxymethylaminomethyl modification enzyme